MNHLHLISGSASRDPPPSVMPAFVLSQPSLELCDGGPDPHSPPTHMYHTCHTHSHITSTLTLSLLPDPCPDSVDGQGPGLYTVIKCDCLSPLRLLYKVPQTRGLINNRNFSLTVLQAGSLRSGYQHGQVLVRALFQVADGHLLTVFSPGSGSKGALWGPFYKGDNPIHEGSTFMTCSPPKGPTSKYRHLGA